MKWCFYEKETDPKARIILIYNVTPPDELGNNFIVVNDTPKEESKKGKEPVLYCNPKTKELWYEYIDKISKEEEIAKIQELEQKVEQKVEQQNQAIADLTTMIAMLQTP